MRILATNFYGRVSFVRHSSSVVAVYLQLTIVKVVGYLLENHVICANTNTNSPSLQYKRYANHILTFFAFAKNRIIHFALTTRKRYCLQCCFQKGLSGFGNLILRKIMAPFGAKIIFYDCRSQKSFDNLFGQLLKNCRKYSMCVWEFGFVCGAFTCCVISLSGLKVLRNVWITSFVSFKTSGPRARTLPKHDPIWVWRALDKRTQSETGPNQRSPVVPGPFEPKKTQHS